MKRYSPSQCPEPFSGCHGMDDDINGEYVKADGAIKALYAATAAIYFADSSDYESALWDVVKCLSPEISRIMVNGSERKAYLAAIELAGHNDE